MAAQREPRGAAPGELSRVGQPSPAPTHPAGPEGKSRRARDGRPDARRSEAEATNGKTERGERRGRAAGTKPGLLWGRFARAGGAQTVDRGPGQVPSLPGEAAHERAAEMCCVWRRQPGPSATDRKAPSPAGGARSAPRPGRRERLMAFR